MLQRGHKIINDVLNVLIYLASSVPAIYYKEKTIMIIEFLKNAFDKKADYDKLHFLTVYEAIYNPCTNQLHIAFLLEEEENREKRFLVTEIYEVGSDEYKSIIRRIYGDFDCEYTCVNTDDFDRFWGTCKLYESDGQVRIDWESFEVDSTPLSAFWKIYHPEAGLKLY